MIQAYIDLFHLGYAHSVEAWSHGQLVGGLYGLLLGRVFFGESMFTRQTDASKVALVSLIAVLRTVGVRLVDCQQETEHLASVGAKPIPRRRFASDLDDLINSTDPPAWPRGTLPELP
jgi:leucyl/phenylalanyl-tRNA--protein transferase